MRLGIRQWAIAAVLLCPLPGCGGPYLGSWEAADINDDGVIVGRVWAYPNWLPVRYTAQTGLRELPLPSGAVSGKATVVAADGTICGYVALTDGIGGPDFDGRAVCWQPSGRILELGRFSGLPTVALSMNNRGVVVGAGVGTKMLGSDMRVAYEPWIYDPAIGHLTPLPVPADAIGTEPRSINDNGEIVGTATYPPQTNFLPVYWAPGDHAVKILPLGALGIAGSAHAINASGTIVGRVEFSEQTHAVTWRPSSDPETLPLKDDYDYASANDINDSGVAVGFQSSLLTGWPPGETTSTAVRWNAAAEPQALRASSGAVAVNSLGATVVNAPGPAVFLHE